MIDAMQLLTDVWGGTVGNFRVFHDSIRDPKLAKKFSGDLNVLFPDLLAYNQQGYGVYFVVNHGGNDDENITHSTAIMIDIDSDKGLPASWHVQPHTILRRTETSNYHVYWLLNHTDDLVEWSKTCKRLINFYGSDPRIHNYSRVMRLPDFFHMKDPSAPSTYQTIYRADFPRYDLSQVAAGLPDVEHTPFAGSRGEVLIESDDVFAIDRATTYLKRAEPAIEGNGGDHQTFATFARLRDFGISLDTALSLAEEHWNPRNQPPWIPDDLRIKAENAYNYAANPQGIANPLAAFQSIGLTPAAPAVQPITTPTAAPPVAVPAPTVAVPVPNTLAGIDPYDVSMGVGYEKNHTTNAARFIQEWYPGATLRHFDDTWYFYDGKCWVEVKEEAMSRALTVAMANASPSASDVSGTLKILKGMVGRKGSLGTFGYRDVSSLLLVQNGILNVATGTLEPHSPDFFTTNILPFAYDPTATCPTWERFIGEVWPEQQDSIDLLEEWIAYNMLRDYSHQKILMMIGASRGGKGTIGRVMLQLIGELNYHGISLEGFANDRVLEGALTKTCLFVGDAMSVSGPNRSKIVERLKTISGGDNTSCARAYKTPFSGVIPGRITIACNNILSFNDDSGTLAKRLLILPFNRSFEGREDPELNAKLSAELPGIANRCIKALARLRSRGRFVEPESAAVERESITYRYSPVQAFVDDECTLGSEERVHCEELYARYKAWCMRSSVRCIPHRPFVDAVRGLMRGKIEKKAVSIGGVRLQGFVGLGLRPDAQPENVTPFPVQGSL